MSSFICFLQFHSLVLFNLCYVDLAPPWQFIPVYFILLDAIVSGIVLLISLSDSLLVCRNTNDFCMLTLYSVALFNLLIFFFFNLCSNCFYYLNFECGTSFAYLG